jgi:hypothetical protein
MDNEREELEALTRSEGWKMFQSYVESEWGPGGRAFIDAVTKAADNKADADATAFLRQIIVAQKQIQRLVKWPEERLGALKQPELVAAGPVDYSRRGRL